VIIGKLCILADGQFSVDSAPLRRSSIIKLVHLNYNAVLQ